MPPVAPSTRTVASSDGVAVVVHHLAPGRPGAPLLVSHATGFHGRAYRPVALALGDRFDGWALDSRGHGSTPAPARWTVDWQRYGDDAEAAATWVAGQAGTGPGLLVGFGHSMGGATLLMTAQRNPDLFRALVLFEPIAFAQPDGDVDPENSPLAVGARRRRRQFESFDAAISHYASKPPLDRFDPGALDEYVRGGFAPVAAERPDGPVELTCAPELEAATFATSQAAGVWEVLPSIQTPVLVVAGRPDPNSPPSLLAEQIAGRLPNARFHLDAELDHFGPFVDPRRVAGLVRSFAA